MKVFFAACLAFASTLTAPAYAALEVGASAPAITAPASLAGKPFTFSLAEALKKGPVVLYFYPKAFTSGCTYEAHAFAEATEAFAKLGATVIGVSNDPIETLNSFSVSECNSKFAVVSDPESEIIEAYDVKIPIVGNAKRVSYVIAPDGKVVFVHADWDPDTHVKQTLEAVKAITRQ